MIERYSRKEMTDIWSENAKYLSWSKVEIAHLQTLIEFGQCPPEALTDFARAYALKTESDYLRRESETGHDVIAFVTEVGDEMGPLTGPFLHRGLTSSDVVDTALNLRILAALQFIDQGMLQWKASLAELSFRHASTLTIGRTHGIHAEPCSFGQIIAGYAAEASRAHKSLLAAATQIAKGKLSGAVGVYSQLPPAFEKSVLAKLALEPETSATQVIPRDRILNVARALENAVLCMERFALNIRHWARTELGEVLEPFGTKQKGSSAMPHKKNPVLAENLCGLARIARAHVIALSQDTALWHERDISHSSVERMALPDLFALTDFMLTRITSLTRNLDVSKEAMTKNLNLTGGLWSSGTLLTALVEKGMNRTHAYELVQSIALPLAKQARTDRIHENAFLDAMKANLEIAKTLSKKEIEEIVNTNRFLVFAPVVFERTFGIKPETLDWNPENHSSSFPVDQIPSLKRIYSVTVSLQPDVLDTEAKTITADMKHDIEAVTHVRQAKTFFIELGISSILHAPHDENEALHQQIRKYATEVLHNEVIEDFKIEVIQ